MNAERRLPALSRRRLLGGLLASLPATRVLAQGYAGMGAEAEGYAAVTPDRTLHFPEDHAAHPAYRIEWWYITANLETDDARPLGVQWTLFRQAASPPGGPDAAWGEPQLWMGHAALTTAERHLSAELFGRGGAGQAGADIRPFRAWIDAWRFRSLGDAFSPLRLSAVGAGFAYDLRLDARGPLVLHGDQGFSRKSLRGQASYYYSQPFFAASGEIEMDGETRAVSGRAWLDREWSSQPLDPDQEGWDWFSLHLPEGRKLMLFRLRGSGDAAYRSGTLIEADGTARALGPDEIAMRPLTRVEVAGRPMPVEWEVALPAEGVRLRTVALNPHAWMDMAFPYWEGPVSFDGSHAGVGYLEMTGY